MQDIEDRYDYQHIFISNNQTINTLDIQPFAVSNTSTILDFVKPNIWYNPDNEIEIRIEKIPPRSTIADVSAVIGQSYIRTTPFPVINPSRRVLPYFD